MTTIEPKHSDHGDGFCMNISLDDPTGIGERFSQSFSRFLQDKKREAVIEVLQEDLPHLAGSDDFVDRVMNKLNDDIVDEKRFVFLVLNPKLRK